MKLYRVVTRKPFFRDSGTLIASIQAFHSKTKAINCAKKKSKDTNCFVKVEELILKDLTIDNLIYAFSNEDIMDLIESRSDILVLRPSL